MKLTLTVFMFCLAGVTASTYSQITRLTVSLKNGTMVELIKQIESKSEFFFYYQKDELSELDDLTVKAKNATVMEILDKATKGTSFDYVVVDRYIVLRKLDSNIGNEFLVKAVNEITAQQRSVSGKVTDSNNQPLPGVTVVVKGTTQGTVSNADGEYTLINIPDGASLIFSFVGMRTQEIAIGMQARIDVRMQEETIGIEEVVAVGYGVQRKATVTGAISSVNSDMLIQTPVSNVSKALVGRVTGLLANQFDSEPGKDQATLRIRGRGTFSGSSDPLILVDGVENSSFNNIDFNEIEDITVLKDASATAVYGVRGANGVIIITTKRGKESKPVISVSSNMGMLTYADLRENLGSYEYAVYHNEARKYDSFVTGAYNPMFTDEQILHYKNGDEPILFPSTDWFNVMMKPNSMQTQQNINIRGGTNMIKYFVSAGYYSQEGLFNSFTSLEPEYVPNIVFRRFNIRANFDFNVTQRLSVNIDLASIIGNKSGNSDGSDNATRHVIGMTYYAPPFSSPGVVDGKIVDVIKAYTPNPIYALMGSGYYRNVSNDLSTTVGFNYKLDFITEGLKTHLKVSNWNRMNNLKRYSKSIQTYQASLLDDGSIIYTPERTIGPFGFSESSGKNRDTYLEVGLNYNRTFGFHTFGGLLLYNQKKLYNPSLAYVIPNGHQGIVGRVTYDYKMRYIAEFNVGYNGTENFAKGKRFGWFPAYSLSWVPTEESFFPKNNIVSYIKIRGSYGEVGNDKIGGSRFLYLPAAYVYSSNADFNTRNAGGSYFGEYGSTFQIYQASYESTLGNPDLTWERAKKTNIGVDLVLLNDKVKVAFDNFHESRDNILTTPQTTPAIVGIVLPVVNWGKVENRGHEGDITYTDNFNNFSYWIKSNYSFARNKILFQDEVPRKYPHMMRTGQSIDQPFGYIAEGFFNTWEEVNVPNRPQFQSQNSFVMPGDTRYKDINGDGILDENDQAPIGYPTFPEVIYGISFGGLYKGFDFSVLFQGTANYSRWYHAANSHIRPFDNALATLSFIPQYSWSPDKYENGETIRLPRLTADMTQSNNYASSTFLLADASYMRLKNVEVGYSFEGNFLKRFQINSCRIYLNGNNLLTWSGLFPGIDPEQGLIGGDNSYYPMTRTFNIGVNIQF